MNLYKKYKNVWFVSDEHMSHQNIIKYCNRPFKNVNEMDQCIIDNHNSVVNDNDIVFHLGDYTMIPKHEQVMKTFVNKLKGTNIFIMGSHDRWLKNNKNINQIVDITIENQPIVMCHYPMHLWPRSHYNSWHLFGHAHFFNTHFGKTYNVSVDLNNFYPISYEQLKNIMKDKPNNPDYIKDRT